MKLLDAGGIMAKPAYPTGVENHGGKLRICFQYKGRRVRENLGVPDTPKNRKVAGELRASVCFLIKTGNFDYAERFPDSPNLKLFGIVNKEITIEELSRKWLDLKELEISRNTMLRYESIVKTSVSLLGGRVLASSVTQEDLLVFRRELMTGYQVARPNRALTLKGRSVVTVNAYMGIVSSMFQFAACNGYIPKTPFSGISTLKKAKAEPDPLSREEFARLIEACHHQQIKNIWSLAVYTGMRHGELCALAWEDIDIKAGTLVVRRNYTQAKEFTLPKTQAGTDRVIHLIQPAIDVLKNQASLTRLGKQHKVEVKLREFGRTSAHSCTFVFNPQLTTRSGKSGTHYAATSLNRLWESAMRRAGLRYRKAYQSRHTYACWSLAVGANPNFIAAQMGHANAQMVYTVYGAWMTDNNQSQVDILNEKLAAFAPRVPQKWVASN
ncbi:site-specific integrase [Salmonella enterica]|nr:site-specific integrase [Salmonella enterica subsp. enterica serovar Bredeney]EDA0855528.1 site-specific integrase [Salmonella enterica]EEJ8781787.1 site-specific integrase [Salmonella enterica subsp. enterica]HAG2568468.1 site-specific integrase [Salmonella enterica]